MALPLAAIFHKQTRIFPLEARNEVAALPPAAISPEKLPLFLKSKELPCGAASGGIFSGKKCIFFLKVRNSLAALPPAAIFHGKKNMYFMMFWSL